MAFFFFGDGKITTREKEKKQVWWRGEVIEMI